ncbi:MAG TPA: hypothetical protein VK782_02140 [Candidatus Sulfotelmatobacter sp.]|jgi:hypothetical protein|nr:hypothetical protein [Candidatus Sulfotelmatobacter sp.]
MADKFELVPGTGTTLDIAHTVGLTVLAMLTALREHSPETLASVRDYLSRVQDRANTMNATDEQKKIIESALGIVTGVVVGITN